MPPLQQEISTIVILNWLLAAGACSVAILGLGEFFVAKKKPINYVITAICLCFSVAVLDYLLQSLGLYREWPWILYLYYPLELLSGPLLFFLFTLLVDRDFKFRSPYLLLFLPVAIATGLMLPYFLREPAAKIAQVPLNKTADPLFGSLYRFIAHNLESWVLGCIALFFARTGLALRRHRIRLAPKIGSVIIFALLFFGAILFYLWVNFFPSESARKSSILVSILLVFPFYFFQRRYPGLFGVEGPERAAERYKDSTKLAGRDTAKIIERLGGLMSEKRLYKNNELSLNELGVELGITAHQLSELLNARLGLNFNQYVNGFRIEEAKRRLGEEKGGTILDIAFDCGFGSKSTFNTAFLKATGKTPSEWRKEGDGGSEL